MSAKVILMHQKARNALFDGIDVVARAVRPTLGPKGRNVALGRPWGLPEISPDGVTVAREIELPDRAANLGAQLLIQAASKTSDVAGDGTTSSTLIAYALVAGGLPYVAAGASPLLLKRGLDRAAKALIAAIPGQAIPVAGRTELAQIATVSSLDSTIGELLATIMDKLGRDAVIAIEEGRGTTTEYEIVEGMQKDHTIIVEGGGDHAAIQARVAQIRAQAEAATDDYERDTLRERAARLSGGVAVVKVGAATETALKERKARLDDALHATRAALAEGIVPGGGVAYLNLIPTLDSVETTFPEERTALDLLRSALAEPARQIAANAGIDGSFVVAEIKRRQEAAGNRNIGYDAMRDEYGDILTWGVIDPAKVVRAALENAISVAGMILSTDALIVEAPEEERAPAEPVFA
jgi:chaperonin GroEL